MQRPDRVTACMDAVGGEKGGKFNSTKTIEDMLAATRLPERDAQYDMLLRLVRSAGTGRAGPGTGFRFPPELDWEPYAMPSHDVAQAHARRCIVAMLLEQGLDSGAAVRLHGDVGAGYVMHNQQLHMVVDTDISIAAGGMTTRGVLMDVLRRAQLSSVAARVVCAAIVPVEDQNVLTDAAWQTGEPGIAALEVLKAVGHALYGAGAGKVTTGRQKPATAAKALVELEQNLILRREACEVPQLQYEAFIPAAHSCPPPATALPAALPHAPPSPPPRCSLEQPLRSVRIRLRAPSRQSTAAVLQP